MKDKLVFALAMLWGLFWIVLSALLTAIYNFPAFLFISIVGLLGSFLIMDLFEEDYLDYLDRIDSQKTGKQNKGGENNG